MPIMTAHGQNDARVAARLLATTAVDCIRNPAAASEKEVALNNVYRLLEALKLNPFFGLEIPATRHTHTGETLASTQPMERHVNDVRLAFDQAIGVVFAGQPKQQAIDQVENILRALAYPERYGRPSQQQLGQASHFFEEVLNRLKFA